MFKKMILLLSILLSTGVAMANAETTVRITKISPGVLAEIQKGQAHNLTIEFREGDRLPVSLKARGDLLVSVDDNPTFVEVKKSFYIRVSGTNILMSFDGVDFRPLNEVIGGKITVGANANTGESERFPANIINVVFSAFVR